MYLEVKNDQENLNSLVRVTVDVVNMNETHQKEVALIGPCLLATVFW